ncbi:hypothetical protein B7R22_04525 [Subtercola boreus]|uniref:MobA-like NTP transferase domain-containing protein n=2 Tax=Subtercola boreus TaxID=120213 RepID=A0A3E0W4R6_9MICO|nr:hypothetical protein B7R22_04525 [Subtercola boreus]
MLLAAGAGRRMGMPKALVQTGGGEPWVVRGTRVLLDSGCSPVVVVLGAGSQQAAQLIAVAFGNEPRLIVRNADLWAEGMSESLRAGIDALSSIELDGVIVTLVDTPSLRPETIDRVRAAADSVRSERREALVQAMFDSRPGHPVFIGRVHWADLCEDLAGDSGARAYLRAHDALSVECSDLEIGEDIDSAETVRP